MKTWGVVWSDGGYTGPIAEHARDLTAYAREFDGTVYQTGTEADPECSGQGGKLLDCKPTANLFSSP